MPLKQRKAKGGSQVSKDAWKTFQMAKVPFLAVPPEIHLKIFRELHPVDAVCLSIVNKYLYSVAPPLNYPLGIGAPDSSNPLLQSSGCRHCLPVLFYPAHCELHFHLSSTASLSGTVPSIIPSHLKFCSCCQTFTPCQEGIVSDHTDYCGKCRISYKRRFERGRRMVEYRRPGEKQEKLRKWYNEKPMLKWSRNEDGEGQG